MHELSDHAFARIAGLMHEAIGISFTPAKRPLIASRLSPRMSRLGIDDFEDYVQLIASRDNAGEFQMAVDLLTTNETYFFREPAHFELIERELARARPASVHVWSAACSFGDEPYSCAMLLADLQAAGNVGSDWSVLGTDISDRVLHSAIAGIVPKDRVRLVPQERLRRHCLRGEGPSEGMVQMSAKLRRHVRFGQINLCAPIEPLGPFDIVFLRNVLIYFDGPTKQAVIDCVLEQLRPGGMFFVGTAEGRIVSRWPLKQLGPGAYRKAAA